MYMFSLLFYLAIKIRSGRESDTLTCEAHRASWGLLVHSQGRVIFGSAQRLLFKYSKMPTYN